MVWICDEKRMDSIIVVAALCLVDVRFVGLVAAMEAVRSERCRNVSSLGVEEA
jgi:hypothetical protein